VKDFFISYNTADKAWAEWIAWTLEEAGYSVIIQEWHIRPGQSFAFEMQKAITDTDRTIAVLSQHYLDAAFTQPEWTAAFAKDPMGDKRALVPVRVGACNLQGLLSQIVYIDLLGLSEVDAQKALCDGLTPGGRPKEKPGFPGLRTGWQAASAERTLRQAQRFPGVEVQCSPKVREAIAEECEHQDSERPTVFICYSRSDTRWMEMLRPHLVALQLAGQLDLWVDTDIDVGGNWRDKLKAAMERTSVAVCLISADFLASPFIIREEVAYFLGQSSVILLPLLLQDCPWDRVSWLSKLQLFPGGHKPVKEFEGANLDRILANFARLVSEIVEKRARLGPEEREGRATSFVDVSETSLVEAAVVCGIRESQWTPLPESCVDTHRLPSTGDALFGRDEQLRCLDATWESPDKNVIIFVAGGGVGKSALVNKWVEQMASDNYRGAQCVYAWSFYSQGTGERVTSSDMFINESLMWFGDEATAKSSMSPWDKGRCLAELIQNKRTLLLLDGIEPLQSNFANEPGFIKDPALSVLVKHLARKNTGLCVITTREPIADIKQNPNNVIEESLDQILPEAGRALLRVRGVRGSDTDLERVTRDFGRHALAINLLAAYLQNEPGRHAERAHSIPDLNLNDKEGRHPRRIMEAFANRFGDSPELNILYMLGLFDRPAKAEEMAALRQKRMIGNLNDKVFSIEDPQWKATIDKLRLCGLVAPPSHHDKVCAAELDAHPFVRQHFGERLRQLHEGASHAGHCILFQHLKKKAPKFPTTIRAMEPLYRAVHHGNMAGRYSETFSSVYSLRVQQGIRLYNASELGALGEELAMLASYFEEGQLWCRPARSLSNYQKLSVIMKAGYYLYGSGKTEQAQGALQSGLDMSVQSCHWLSAMVFAGGLSQIRLATGQIRNAMELSSRTREYADCSFSSYLKNILVMAVSSGIGGIGGFMKGGPAFKHWKGIFTVKRTAMMATEAVNADIIFNKGDVPAAMQHVQRVLPMLQGQPMLPLFYSLVDFWCNDILLAQGDHEKVCLNAKKRLQFWENKDGKQSLFDIGTQYLLLGRAYLVSARQVGEKPEKSLMHLDMAIEYLRRASFLEFLVRALVSRAEARKLNSDFPSAIQDLDAAWEIVHPNASTLQESNRGNVRHDIFMLRECDIHLECCRLLLTMKNAGVALDGKTEPGSPLSFYEGVSQPIRAAREHLTIARRMADEMEYFRCVPAICLAGARLHIMEGDPAQARHTLAEASKYIESMNYHSLDRDLNEIKRKLSV
jgi:tetratricopeptide (TPR) repeat protein